MDAGQRGATRGRGAVKASAAGEPPRSPNAASAPAEDRGGPRVLRWLRPVALSPLLKRPDAL